MTKLVFILLIASLYIITVVLIVVVLNLINKSTKRKYERELNTLEREKNLIISASILSELNKVEALLNNEELEEKYADWQKRFKDIKDKDVPHITDQLIIIEDLMNEKKYKEIDSLFAKAEMDIYYVKMRANFLLNEIKELTLSEQKNREIVVKLKSDYREVITKYNKNKSDYKEVSGPFELQFETVDKLFSAFEIAMESNSYTEVGKIVKAMGDTIGNLKIIIDEAPSIIIMGKSLIPKKMKELQSIYEKMLKEGYPLEYINLNYNILESEKKISDIFARLNVLNVEDSIFELKTMLDYFDSLYNDFDKEKIAKKLYYDYQRSIGVKISKLVGVAKSLYKKVGNFQLNYDVTAKDMNIIQEINQELSQIKNNYDSLVSTQRGKTIPYSKLTKEAEIINMQMVKTEDKLDLALRTIGSLKEDELRAREQLDEIKSILKDAKKKINSFKLPHIPRNYYIELAEASDAIKEVIKELETHPISIRVLNTRVDTARDLVLKLYNTTKETVKTAYMAEMAIVYGNRYRPINKELDFGLTKAENLFFKGNFRTSLENAIIAISVVEPDFHHKLMEQYQ